MRLPAKFIEGGILRLDDLDLSPGDSGVGGAIFLIRHREINEKLFKGGNGTAVFYADNVVCCNDADPLSRYWQLSNQEDYFKEGLTAWALQTGREFIGADILNVDIKETTIDCNNEGSILKSRATIRVTWSKRAI